MPWSLLFQWIGVVTVVLPVLIFGTAFLADFVRQMARWIRSAREVAAHTERLSRAANRGLDAYRREGGRLDYSFRVEVSPRFMETMRRFREQHGAPPSWPDIYTDDCNMRALDGLETAHGFYERHDVSVPADPARDRLLDEIGGKA